MPNLEVMKQIAKDEFLDLHESSNGTFLMEFPKARNNISVLLVSADGGKTWCPEAVNEGGKMWSGRVALTGYTLETEIRDMMQSLNLGNADQIVQVGKKLVEEFVGEKSH